VEGMLQEDLPTILRVLHWIIVEDWIGAQRDTLFLHCKTVSTTLTSLNNTIVFFKDIYINFLHN